jgi:hypothetical protein
LASSAIQRANTEPPRNSLSILVGVLMSSKLSHDAITSKNHSPENAELLEMREFQKGIR